jgi:D-serine deaminase-like pyridoxal phosphate-dependent protein
VADEGLVVGDDQSVRVHDLPTPALIIDADVLESNLGAMAAALPGARLRPHVKAHKCTALARRQAVHGHSAFTCATPREALGLAAVGLGDDVLIANEVLDRDRLRALAAFGDTARITVAVDSEETIDAAAAAGLREVLIDVNVGLPRCGCAPEDAALMAERARRAGLSVRGVMGYEGHLMAVTERGERVRKLADVTGLLAAAHAAVGGDVVSTGGTGTYDLHSVATEVQAGSYALMDTAYAALGLPFGQALFVLATVVSVSPGWAVGDAGLKSLAMDHGQPSIDGATVWFCSDEHVTFAPEPDGPLVGLRPGSLVRVIPAHVDPTMALHERVHVVQGDDVLDTWAIDLRGW